MVRSCRRRLEVLHESGLTISGGGSEHLGGCYDWRKKGRYLDNGLAPNQRLGLHQVNLSRLHE